MDVFNWLKKKYTDSYYHKDYYRNGSLKEEGFLRKGKKEGEWSFYYENGNVESEGFFTDDNKDYAWSYFYESGNIKEQVHYDLIFLNLESLESIKTGEYKRYYENGNIETKGSFGKSQNKSVKIGKWFYYYASGGLKSKGGYIDGKKNHSWEFYYEKGELLAKGSMKNGKKVDSWEEYYTDGFWKARGAYVYSGKKELKRGI